MALQIIVIDAEPVVRNVVAKTLERAGFSVQASSSLGMALEISDNFTPDLFVTNVFLPGITGHDAMRVLKTRCPGVPVLMVSGLPDSEAIQEWIKEKGFDAFPKPFLPKDLVAKVNEVLASGANSAQSS